MTVLVDTYNHERFIDEALVSVLEQDFPSSEIEIIVVDDGSTDRTPEILRKFAPRVRVLSKQNGGQASAFNVGIPEARGEIVAFLDGDDWWRPNKLTHVMNAMATDASIGIVGHGITVVQQDGDAETEVLRDGFRFRATDLEGARLFRLRRSFLGTSRMTIRTALLREIGPVPEAIAIEADEYLFTLAALLADVQILPEALTYYRVHDANGYQMKTFDARRVRRKYESLDALTKSLTGQLIRYDIPLDVRRVLTGIVRAEADQLRLSLGDGWSWETVRTEWAIYRTFQPNAPAAHRVFKVASLLPALLVPPRYFYQLRGKIISSEFYLRARKRWLPISKMTHIGKTHNMTNGGIH